jgi:tetratricopeptide (TPR) repeat protein
MDDSATRASLIVRWLTAAGAGIGLLVLAFIALCWGVADTKYEFASRGMARWSASPTAPEEDDWLAIRGALARADSLDGRNPAILGSLGLAYLRQPAATGDAYSGQQQALKYFQQALLERPTSPYTWGNVALVKYRLGQTDADLMQALSNATRLGPWEPEVQFAVADIGLALWDDLFGAQRAEVKGMVGRGMKRDADSMVRIAEKRGRLKLACGSSADALKHSKCQQLADNGRNVVN